MCVFHGLLFQSRAALLFITTLKECRFKCWLNLAAFLHQTVVLCRDHAQTHSGNETQPPFLFFFLIICCNQTFMVLLLMPFFLQCSYWCRGCYANLTQLVISHQEKPKTGILRKLQIRVKVHQQKSFRQFKQLIAHVYPEDVIKILVHTHKLKLLHSNVKDFCISQVKFKSIFNVKISV